MPQGVRLGVAVALAGCVALSTSASADAPLAALPVRLAVATSVPDASRLALKREVVAIWRRAGIAIDWREDAAASADTFRVLVTTAEPPRTNDGHTWPVAELLFDTGGRPLAVASLPAAHRILDTAGVRDEPSSLRTRRLGLVLGRAVAHEIGHYLLTTSGHRSRGLMRTRIDAGEFADLRDGGFWLDRDAVQTLRVARPLAGLVSAPVLVAQR